MLSWLQNQSIKLAETQLFKTSTSCEERQQHLDVATPCKVSQRMRLCRCAKMHKSVPRFILSGKQGWAGMTFEGSGTGRELKKPIPEIREREGNWKSPFPKFGNGKGIKKSIPKFREWEGNEKIPFPKFGNGKGMKKIHSQNSGTGREWKKSIPEIREREGNEKIHSQSSGKGIRGLHSWECPGTGIPAHPCKNEWISPSISKNVNWKRLKSSRFGNT